VPSAAWLLGLFLLALPLLFPALWSTGLDKIHHA
jgi:hypothetical protein